MKAQEIISNALKQLNDKQLEAETKAAQASGDKSLFGVLLTEMAKRAIKRKQKPTANVTNSLSNMALPE